jgi:hypothetical protein
MKLCRFNLLEVFHAWSAFLRTGMAILRWLTLLNPID